jgi:hypothetical protein
VVEDVSVEGHIDVSLGPLLRLEEDVPTDHEQRTGVAVHAARSDGSRDRVSAVDDAVLEVPVAVQILAGGLLDDDGDRAGLAEQDLLGRVDLRVVDDL